MTHESMLALASAIAHHPQLHLDVLDLRHEVLWPDGSAVHLHPVRQRDTPARLLWAFHTHKPLHESGFWAVIGLQHVTHRSTAQDRSLAEELQRAPERDVPGLLIYGLRRAFVNAEAFRAMAYQHALASWPGEGRAPGSRPTRTGRQAAQVEG